MLKEFEIRLNISEKDINFLKRKGERDYSFITKNERDIPSPKIISLRYGNSYEIKCLPEGVRREEAGIYQITLDFKLLKNLNQNKRVDLEICENITLRIHK